MRSRCYTFRANKLKNIYLMVVRTCIQLQLCFVQFRRQFPTLRCCIALTVCVFFTKRIVFMWPRVPKIDGSRATRPAAFVAVVCLDPRCLDFFLFADRSCFYHEAIVLPCSPQRTEVTAGDDLTQEAHCEYSRMKLVQFVR